MGQAVNPEQSHRKARIISVIAATAIALSCGTNYAFLSMGAAIRRKIGVDGDTGESDR